MCKLKHLAVAAAIIGLATHVQAGYFPGSTDFEDTPLTNAVIWSGVDNVAEAIVSDATVGSAGRATYRPLSFSTTDRENVLSVDNDAASPIVCNINGGAAMPASTIYADALVKGAPLANDASVPDVGPTDKLLVYTRVNAAGTDTNLCVLAKPDANSITNEFIVTSTHIGKDEWHRIIIEAVNDGTYKVYYDGYDANSLCGTYYPITAGSSMSSVAFAGTGSVDDLILSDLIPELPVHTLTWDTSFSSVSYVVGNETNNLQVSDGSFEFQVPNGTSVTLIGNTGYYDVTATGTAAAGSVLALNVTAPTGLKKFSPDATGTGTGTENDPYTIPDYATLVAMRIAVANDASFRSVFYEQTADIALEAAWPGIGIQNGKDLVTGNDSQKAEFNEGAFCGTYDGGNFTISNFQMVGVAGNPANNGEGLDYCGFFNSTYEATICNLTIAYKNGSFAADTAAGTKESGATFVGVAKNSTLRNLTTVAGMVSCSKGFGGIVGYLSGTTVDSCTNNLNMTSLANNKCGGIAMICQQSGCSILNCQNNGTVTTNSGEHGGILGYTDTITISNCKNTAACKMFYHHGGTVTLSGTNKGNSTVQSYTGNATPGLNFATADGNVATFVADTALAAGNTYKVMASGATATYAFTAPGTISFDTALFTPTYAITAAQELTLTDATVGTVKTYTAAAAPSYKDPEGVEIGDPVLIDWLSANGFSQDDIDALGRDAAATDKLYECWLLNCSITAQNPGGTISITAIAVSNKVSITVQLVRQDPLGYISGVLHLYGAENLAAGFSRSPISEEIVGFSEGDSTFATTETEGAVTQSVTANFSPTDVTAKFFKAVIEFPIADNGDGEGGEEEGGGEE